MDIEAARKAYREDDQMRLFVDKVATFKRNANTMKVQRLLQLIGRSETQGAIAFMEKMGALKAGTLHLARPKEESYIEWAYPISKIGKLIKGDIDEEQFQDEVGEFSSQSDSPAGKSTLSLDKEKRRLAELLNLHTDQIEITIRF
ncbi:MAG: hypothetical protein AAFO78_11260 [Pseudomonadota bacterium]